MQVVLGVTHLSVTHGNEARLRYKCAEFLGMASGRFRKVLTSYETKVVQDRNHLRTR